MSANENPGPYTLNPYIIQSVLLLVAPALFAASIYMELGRIVQMLEGDRALFIRRTWLTKIFVAGDVLSFLMQSSGELALHIRTIFGHANTMTQAPVSSQPPTARTLPTPEIPLSLPVSCFRSSSSVFSSSQQPSSTLALEDTRRRNAATRRGKST